MKKRGKSLTSRSKWYQVEHAMIHLHQLMRSIKGLYCFYVIQNVKIILKVDPSKVKTVEMFTIFNIVFEFRNVF